MRREITSTTTAILQPIGSAGRTSGPLYAINWFNTRWAWLYTLYNVLAARLLLKSGGRPVLKANHRKTIDGPASAERQVLLIVQYPSGDSFLDLLQNRMFQVVSLLRMLAVKDFSFVFHRRYDDDVPFESQERPLAGDKAYAVHHFRSPEPLRIELQRIRELAEDRPISVFFVGEKTASVAIEKNGEPPQVMPFETHKSVIFESDRHEMLETFLCAPAYQAFSARLGVSYIATFDRVL